MALGWIGATTGFGSVERNANMSFVVSPSLTFRTDVQRVQIPVKNASERRRRASFLWQMNPTDGPLRVRRRFPGSLPPPNAPRHSGRPILRKAMAHNSASSGPPIYMRMISSTGPNLKFGSSSRNRRADTFASSSRPASAKAKH